MRPTAKASRYTARVSHATSDSESDDESDAAQFISREAEDASEDEAGSSEEGEDGEESEDGDDTSSAPTKRRPRNTPSGSRNPVESESSSEDSSDSVANSKDEEDGDDDHDDKDDEGDSDSDSDSSDFDDLPPMQLFTSQPVKPTARPLSQTPVPLPSSAMPRLGAPLKKTAVKKAESESESESESDPDSESDSSSGSSSDFETEAPAFPSLSQEKVKQKSGADAANAASQTESSSSDSSSDSDSDSDSDSASRDDAESSVAVKADVVAEEKDISNDKDADVDADVDSSDDGLDEIPSVLPPGTQADVPAATYEEGPEEVEQLSKEASEAPEPREVPVTETADLRASPYDVDGLPATPVPLPKHAARPRSAIAPSSQDTPSSSQQTAQKQRSARKQKAKVPLIEKAAADEETPDAVSEEPAEPMEPMDVDRAERAEAVEEAPSTLPEKRKRGPVEEALDEHDNPETPAPTNSKKTAKKASAATAAAAPKTPETPKTPKISRPRVSNGGGASTAGSLKKGPQGNFTPKEVEVMKRVAQQYMEDNDMRQSDLNIMVHDNARKHPAFWKAMIAEFPDHKRLQVILRCRRVFHSFSHTYHWTPEHDIELAEHYSKHGNKWQLIGGLMDRSAEDVRKRWDEYVVCGDKVQKSYWRFEEEKKLGHVVGEVLKEIQQSRGQDTTLPDEDAINNLPWQIISERMGFTRTARQCRVKWRVIHQSYHFNADGDLVGPPEPEHLTQSQVKAEKLKGVVWSTVQSPAAILAARAPRSLQSVLAKRSVSATPKSAAKSKTRPASKGDEFRKSTVIPLLGITPDENGRTVPETDRPISDKARQQVRSMTTADKHTLVLSIRDSNVGREDMIPWPRITDASFRKKYSRAARELVWSRLKRSVPNYHRKSVRQICDHLIAAYDADQSVWNAELDDGDDASNNKDMGKAKGKAKDSGWANVNGSKKNPAKSNAYVAESDSDAVDDDMEDEDEDEDEDDEDGEDGEDDEDEVEKSTRHPRAARKKVNGYAEKQVLESEEESNGEAGEEKAKKKEQDDIEDATDAESEAEVRSAKSRSIREPSVDLSVGDNLAAEGPIASIEGAGEEEDEAEYEHRLTDDLFPLTQSLSPGLAKHKPTALARMRSINNPHGQQSASSASSAASASASASKPMAKRFGTTNPGILTPLAKQRNANGEVRRTKKRSLGSAQWYPDIDGSGDTGNSSVYDDIEDASDDARHSQTIRGLGDFGSDGPRSAKRLRQENPKRVY